MFERRRWHRLCSRFTLMWSQCNYNLACSPFDGSSRTATCPCWQWFPVHFRILWTVHMRYLHRLHVDVEKPLVITCISWSCRIYGSKRRSHSWQGIGRHPSDLKDQCRCWHYWSCWGGWRYGHGYGMCTICYWSCTYGWRYSPRGLCHSQSYQMRAQSSMCICLCTSLNLSNH